MKVKFVFYINIKMKDVYDLVTPLISKKDFLEEIKYEINQYGEAYKSGEGLDWKHETLTDMIIFRLVQNGFCKFTDRGIVHFEHFR